MRFLFLSVVLLFLSIQDSFANASEELFLEEDPDEQTTDASDGILQRRGYEELFSLNEEEVAGLKEVLIPVKKNIADLEIQSSKLSLQQKRIQEVKRLILQKSKKLAAVSEELKLQKRLLQLEMKQAHQQFQKLLLSAFRVKREVTLGDGKVNLVQLFSNAAPKELLFQDYLFSFVQAQLKNNFVELSQKKLHFQLVEKDLSRIQEQLTQYAARMVSSDAVISEQSKYLASLLDLKREEAAFFQRELDSAIRDQQVIQKRIEFLGASISPYHFRNFPKEALLWPVEPLLGISAFFKDQEYFERFGIEHTGIDIPTDQLTPVKAALSGKVVKAHDGGLGYSYVQLAHRDSFSTVYGHVFQVLVSEGDQVEQGQIIALSGGALGTQGAGKLTTGPHVHFEMLQDGIGVNPLEFLRKRIVNY